MNEKPPHWLPPGVSYDPFSDDPFAGSTQSMSHSDLKNIARRFLGVGPQPGQVYTHYKGGIYAVVLRSFHEKTYRQMVTYASNAYPGNVTRTLAEWTEPAVVDGVSYERFPRIKS